MSANTDAPSLGKALETLRDAMRARGGSTTDPDRRRAAATLSELLRSEEDELERFAARHLPGRKVDPDTIKALQDLVLDVARLVALHGQDGDRQVEASALSATVRATLLAGLESLERAPDRAVPAEQRGTAAGAVVAQPPRAIAVPSPRPIEQPPRRYETPSYVLAAASPAVPAPPPPPPTTSMTLPDVVDEETRMDGTVCDDEPVVGPAMPFQPAPPSVRSVPTPVPPPRKPGAHLSSTAPLSRAAMGAALPFQAPRAPGPALPMPVERYAAFLAELSRDYARAPAIRARYGIVDEGAQRDLGAAFASAFDRDPALRSTFDELLRRMRQGGQPAT